MTPAQQQHNAALELADRLGNAIGLMSAFVSMYDNGHISLMCIDNMREMVAESKQRFPFHEASNG